MNRMSATKERDYVLGTHDAEVQRLGFQHGVWQSHVRQAWLAAGIGPGTRVVDVGAGPGFATLDLAELVGPLGRVVAVERSGRFVDVLKAACQSRGFSHVDAHELDLMQEAIPATDLDAAWCRWVACFVSDPLLLLKRVHACLRPGGTLVLHEYVDYSTYSCLPDRPAIEAFVQETMSSWRASGGEPDIARQLPTALHQNGFRVMSTRPIGMAVTRNEPAWNWPAGFVRTHVDRLLELGRVDAAWVAAVLADLEAAEADPNSVFITPLVLQIIAEKV